jgi:hypothetical protein
MQVTAASSVNTMQEAQSARPVVQQLVLTLSALLFRNVPLCKSQPALQ